MEILLNSRTSALCFNKEDFMVEDFTVDKFVSNCRKYVSLETMLEDLGLYHKILCSAMVELINKDYADFVNLSSNLVGLDKSIKNLSFPLEKLRTEVEGLKINLDETLDNANSKFLEYSAEHKRKVLAHHFLCVLEGLQKIEHLTIAAEKVIPAENLERIALDFNLVQFHINKISSKEIEDKKEILEKVAYSLKQHLEYLFLQSLSECNFHTLCKVLLIYSVINKEKEVETYFRQTVVKPYMKKHLTEENILKHGLTKVYNKVLDFIPNLCSSILNATRGTIRSSEVVPGYDFLVNAVWPEIVACFELIAPVHVYAPGDPQLFHQNYTSSILFLDEFEHYCQVQTSVQRLRKHDCYKKFIDKWNLDVYFQIRFQEIAGKFESCISANPKGGEGTDGKYLLNASCSILQCIKQCWDEKIFLPSLSYNFFRLTLQLISRFSKWTCMTLKCVENKEPLSPVEVAMIMKDMELLIPDLQLFFIDEISVKVSRVLIEGAFQESIKSLEIIIPLASSVLIQILLKQCCSHLKLITDIPRLYRKTNRTLPSKPSGYVSLVFDAVATFLTATQTILSPNLKQYCLKEVTDGIITECFVMIKDVLTSIKKMEDSLKILKRARDKPTLGQAASGAISDDDKIRRQLAIDINNIEERVQRFGLKTDSIKNLKELKKLVNSTEKNVP